ncbi:unnamed protein product [Rotaria magnacalcarata]|uniref:Uncharacterized protein n=2 Tax=Rotaria magnacalcarata TaxID=392030 RepID=A0A816CQL1_9BILA|nr:unnamed protein product [Rotaria magnacalcarata]CAF1628290.1 unnamed protein product [Rotaria magnacalcarata]CAF2025190.1 unnamed protein product [Rotaria magnacalcarata]CAF2047776.1 unnamed protein product [Rotaria magnacalcarata]CAF2112319.1 unnamed protein product [Rotaria magnacalcarata]
MDKLSFNESEEEAKTAERNSPTLSSNDDLRELCFVLDAERNKMHELAEQWRQFGTSTIHKLECQIVDYQEKLSELEQRQILLLHENESLKSFINQTMMNTNETNLNDKKVQQNVSTQTQSEKQESSHHLCFHRPKPMYDRLSRTTSKVQLKESVNKLTRRISSEDSLQQQISIQNMFDAIKTAEVYESIEDMVGDNDESEKKLLKEFCNLIWKYLEDRSKPKSSCLL